MKPTQEQILKALNKLVRENKTELKAEKIELGIIDDLTDGLKFLQKQDAIVVKQLKTIGSDFSSLKKKVDTVKEISSKNMKGVAQGEANIKRIEKQLKELGIDATKVPVIKQFKKAVSEAKENRKVVQSIPDIPKL